MIIQEAIKKQLVEHKKNGEWNKIVALIENNGLQSEELTSELAFAYSKIASNSLDKSQKDPADHFKTHIKYYQKAEQLFLSLLIKKPQSLKYLRSMAFFYKNEYDNYKELSNQVKAYNKTLKLNEKPFNLLTVINKNAIQNRALLLYFLAYEQNADDIKTNSRYAALIYSIFNDYRKSNTAIKNNYDKFLLHLSPLDKILSEQQLNKFKYKINKFTGNKYDNAIELINRCLSLYAALPQKEKINNKKYYINCLYYYCRWTLDLTKYIPIESYLTFWKLDFLQTDIWDILKNETIITKHKETLKQRLHELIRITGTDLNPKNFELVIKAHDKDNRPTKESYYIYYIIAQYYERFELPSTENSLEAFNKILRFYEYSCTCEYLSRVYGLRNPEFKHCYDSFFKYYSVLNEEHIVLEKFKKQFPKINIKMIRTTIEYISILRLIHNKNFKSAEDNLEKYKNDTSINAKKFQKLLVMLNYYRNKETDYEVQKKYAKYIRKMNNTL